MDYGDLFSRAWRIVWNKKFMLVLGFLAALGGSSSNNFTYNLGLGDFPTGVESRIESFLTQFLPVIFGLICLGFLIAIFLWLLRLTAQAGLIESAARLDAGEDVSFGQAISWGISKLGRIVGINLLLYGPFIILMFILFVLGLAIMAATIGSSIASGDEGIWSVIAGSLAIFIVCLGLMACILVPVWLILTVIYPFAQRGAVLQNLGVIESIRQAWQVIKANIGDVALLVLFFIAIGFGFGIVMALLMIPLAFLAFFPMIMEVIMTGNFDPGNIILVLCGSLLVAIVVALINSVIVAFRSTTITLAYQQFIAKAK